MEGGKIVFRKVRVLGGIREAFSERKSETCEYSDGSCIGKVINK